MESLSNTNSISSRKRRKSSPIPCPLYLALSPGHTPPPSSPDSKDPSSPLQSKNEPSFLSLQVKLEELAATPSPPPYTATHKSPSNKLAVEKPRLRSSPRLSGKLNPLPGVTLNGSQLVQTKSATRLWTSSAQSSLDTPSQSNDATSGIGMSDTQSHAPPPLGPPTAGVEVAGSHLVKEPRADGVLPIRDGHHPKFRTRSVFHEESVYFMDAKDKGNVGRFLNVSCLDIVRGRGESFSCFFPWELTCPHFHTLNNAQRKLNSQFILTAVHKLYMYSKKRAHQ